ncbi:YraN family protein [Allopusillimonas ginsengisoli]|uniref:YraN family protein n=1 Tax=Allopusillimonas ginsengisoli TaxID=453575 RepID=UPI00101EDF9C|nr:YraN family protein [Allopusillimonas ginsengisoli]TEA78329.1 YraN family protein [Allopusillimonas ginsengisoli]
MADDTLTYELAGAARHRKARRPRQRARDTRRVADELLARSPTQRTGHKGEQAARAHLETQGLTILGHNLRTRTGELDLVADDGGTLVFIEVRLRQSSQFGGAAASVTLEKQARLVRAAHAWLPTLCRRYYAGRTPPCRFDVVSLEPGALHWIRNAFST